MKTEPLLCPKCNKEPRVVVSMVGSYVRCPWCDFSTYMQTTTEDALKLWNTMAKNIKAEGGSNMQKAEAKDNIVSIDIKEIYPHPDNPRKDIGDVTELAESIRKKGVMQNLTVIPGHWITPEEWKALAKQDRENPSEERRQKMNSRWSDDGYTLIIGHRRCAASKLAGLTEVPCRIVEGMSKKEQVSTMLEENMQRNDLTIYEQAQGFQMMLDLGETEESIAEKTGFSKTTIRHRLNIAKLDQKELKKKNEDDGFQLSLKDLYELEKIPDVKVRNKILREATNSNNLASKAKSCLEELKRKENEKKYKKIFRRMGIEAAPMGTENEMYSNKWKTVKSFELSKEVPENIKLNIDAEKCFYITYWREMRIITRIGKKKQELTPEEKKIKERDKRKKQLKAIQKEMSVERTDFIKLIIEKKFTPEKKETADLSVQLFCLMLSCSCWMNDNTMCKFLYDKSHWEMTDEEKAEFENKVKTMPLIYQLLIYANRSVSDKDASEWNTEYHKSNGKILAEFDGILETFGFSYTKEEYKQVVDGTHELYEVKEESKNE